MENFERVLNSTSGTIWLMWDGSHTTAWNGGTNIQRRQRRRNDITVGTVALSDLIYIYCCPIKSIAYKKSCSAIVYSMAESCFVILSPCQKIDS